MTSSPASSCARPAEQSWILALVFALCLVPLAVTPVFPFVDFYAHAARYHVLATLGSGGPFDDDYVSRWELLPNLGLDLLGVGLMKLLPPLMVGHVLVLLIFSVLYGGVLFAARQVRGRIGPLTALLAGLMLHNHILIWGFTNFLFGLGLAFWGIGLWVALEARPGRQLGLAVAFSVGLFLVHALSFGLYGLLLVALEIGLLIERGTLRVATLAGRLARLASLAVLPVILFLMTATADAEGGFTPAITNLQTHLEAGRFWSRVALEISERIDVLLRVTESASRWVDYPVNLVLWGGLAAGLATGRLRLETRLVPAVGLCLLLLALIPPGIFGSGYVFDRIPLVLFATLIVGVSARPDVERTAVILAAGLLAIKLTVVTASWAGAGQVYRQYIADLEAVESGRLMAFFQITEDPRDGFTPRCAPLSPLAALLRNASVPMFANPGQQPIRIVGPLAAAMAQANVGKRPDFRFEPPGDYFERRTEAIARSRFDYAVICGAERLARIPDTLETVRHRAPYGIYRIGGPVQ